MERKLLQMAENGLPKMPWCWSTLCWSNLSQFKSIGKSILVFLPKIRSVHSLHIAPLVVKDQAALKNVIGILKNVFFNCCTLIKFHVFLTAVFLYSVHYRWRSRWKQELWGFWANSKIRH